jgi:hypothetical protein
MNQGSSSPARRELPNVTVGAVDEAAPPLDWRAERSTVSADGTANDDDYDDAPLLPYDTLVAILGFDPEAVDEDGNDLVDDDDA